MNTKQLKIKLKTLSNMLKQAKNESIAKSEESMGEINYPFAFGYLTACIEEVYQALDEITNEDTRKEVK